MLWGYGIIKEGNGWPFVTFCILNNSVSNCVKIYIKLYPTILKSANHTLLHWPVLTLTQTINFLPCFLYFHRKYTFVLPTLCGQKHAPSQSQAALINTHIHKYVCQTTTILPWRRHARVKKQPGLLGTMSATVCSNHVIFPPPGSENIRHLSWDSMFISGSFKYQGVPISV